ncbi:MAG: T9SS type A sorting domain-containing protein, partial [Bacteroidetes bacterium]|nr:T9SS type A sorting domain-containing protein [Bacteroidota bacterium]
LTRLRLDNQLEKRAKLHAPASFNGGSSVGHLDNLFNTLEGGVHKLMTPSIGSGEIILGTGVTREILGDLGWFYTFIEHEGLNDIEDFAVPRTVTATISSDTQIDTTSFKLLYSLNNFEQTSDTVQLVHQGNGVFTAEIPAPGTIALVSYYLIIDDESQRQFTQPSTAPDFFFQYFARIDEEAPELTHSVPVNFITESETSINLLANASDNLGLESVVVEYNISGAVQTPFNMIFTPGEFSPNRHTGIMNFSGFTLQPGDIINYRIIATDSSTNQNQTISPATGFHSIPVEGVAQATQEYENNFEANSTDFIGDLFTRLKPVGFTDTAFHSDHPYVAAGQGNELNFITQLRFPIIIKNDSTLIQFDEIVLVEPGGTGTVFGDQNFWDYVIVEGSIDNGATWIPFLDGYDSRDNSNWLAEWNKLNSNGQDSDGVGNSGLFVTRTIDMLASGNFSTGDEVLIRFRMFSDPFAFGWGWAIDNLKIQKELVVGIDEVLSDEKELKIFPNPTNSGLINIRANFLQPVDKIRITITGIIGNRVFEQEILNTGNDLYYQLDMSRIPNGIYILNLELKDGNITRKIIKAN